MPILQHTRRKMSTIRVNVSIINVLGMKVISIGNSSEVHLESSRTVVVIEQSFYLN